MVRYEVKVGDRDSFDGIECDLDADHRRHRGKDESDHFASKVAAIVSAVFVVTAGGYGLITQDWKMLTALWVFLGPVVGALIGKNVTPSA